MARLILSDASAGKSETCRQGLAARPAAYVLQLSHCRILRKRASCGLLPIDCSHLKPRPRSSAKTARAKNDDEAALCSIRAEAAPVRSAELYFSNQRSAVLS